MKSDFKWLQRLFPKKRPPLPGAYQAIYEEEYKRNRGSKDSNFDLKKILESWMHKQISIEKITNGDILEIGAGTLNHVNYECKNCAYDIIEPFESLYRDQPALSRIRNIYSDISEISTSKRYSKILSVAVLEHVEDLPHLVCKSALLLEDEGVMMHAIPSEGGLLWYLGWRLGTGLSFRIRTGLPYAPLMRYEHINNANDIVRVLKIFFQEITCTRFPLPYLQGSFYTTITLKKPNKVKANAYLKINNEKKIT